MGSELPYYCPELRGEYLNNPCPANLSKARELQKGKKYFLGFLERCLECQGTKLQVRKTMPEEEKEVPKEVQKWAVNGDLRIRITGALDKLLKKSGQKEVPRLDLARELGVSSPTLRNYLKPMEEAGYIVLNQGPAHSSPVMVGFSDVGKKMSSPDQGVGGPDEPPEQPEPPKISPNSEKEIKPCKKCGVNPEVVNSLGRHTGECHECLSLRTRENLAKGPTASNNRFWIPLNDPKYQEVKEWLEQVAVEMEQDLPRAVMYHLKLAHRRATNFSVLSRLAP